MARVYRRADAMPLQLPGRTSVEILSGRNGAQAVTLRLVSIPVAQPGDLPRAPHHHAGVEECIYVLSGRGTTVAASGRYDLEPGDTILLPAGEHHATRNTGREPLVLLCFYPTGDVGAVTQEPDPSQ